jgi:hypothetical protein
MLAIGSCAEIPRGSDICTASQRIDQLRLDRWVVSLMQRDPEKHVQVPKRQREQILVAKNTHQTLGTRQYHPPNWY